MAQLKITTRAENGAFVAEVDRLWVEIGGVINGTRADVVSSALGTHLAMVLALMAESPDEAERSIDDLASGIRLLIRENWDDSRMARSRLAQSHASVRTVQ